LNTPDLF